MRAASRGAGMGNWRPEALLKEGLNMSHTQAWSDSGGRLLIESIERNQSALNLAQRLLTDPKSVELCCMASGMVSTATQILNGLHKRTGVRFSRDAAWLNDKSEFCTVYTNREFNAGQQRRRKLLYTLAKAIDECARRRYISVTRPQLKRATAPAPAVPAKPETPQILQVEIVSLPSRLTTTEITRDDAGNIKSSAQLERDLAA
jgi:hypothetical protein